MSQNDFVIANQTAPNFRADLNTALQALASVNSGATAPSTTYANMMWYDTANNILKMRSEADDAWIDLGTLDQGANTFEPAGLVNLSQVQVEDDTDTTFGQVSGQRLAQSFDANEQQVGVGQTWVNVTGSRSAGSTSYQNTTGRPIQVLISVDPSASDLFQVSTDNSTWVTIWEPAARSGDGDTLSAIIPNEHYYRYVDTPDEIMQWAELR